MAKKTTNGSKMSSAKKKASAKKPADVAKKKTTPSAAPRSDAATQSGVGLDDSRSPEEKKSALLAALADALGIALFACKRVDVPYDEYLAWRRDDPEFARQADLIDERAIDFVEGKAFEEIKKGNARLIQFFLQTKGRGRGYARETAKEKASKPASPLDFLTDDELGY